MPAHARFQILYSDSLGLDIRVRSVHKQCDLAIVLRSSTEILSSRAGSCVGADSDIRKDTSAPVPSICVEGGLTDSKKAQQQFTPVSMAVYGVHSRGSLSILKPSAPGLSGRSRSVPRQSKQPLIQAFKTAERGASGLDVNGMRPTSPAAWQIMREELRARRVRSLPAYYSFHVAFLSAAWCILGSL